MLAWQLYGAGFENLGKNGQPVEIPVPVPADDEIVVRVDAVGLCFSDVKLIKGGSSHPRILGRDLKRNPTIPGHEVSVTVVKVGRKRGGTFSVGQRYIIQADVFYRGENAAFGYAIPGGFAQYALIDKRMLEGDEGCYLLPMQKRLGYAEAALIEPWACVVAAYRIVDRTGTRPRGRLLVVIWRGAEKLDAISELSSLLRSSARPSSLFLSDDDGKRADEMMKIARESGIEGTRLPLPAELSDTPKLSVDIPDGFDDIVLIAPPSCEVLDKFIPFLGTGGMLNVVVTRGLRGTITLDAGAVHYRGVRIVGSDRGTLLQQYRANDRRDLKPAGAAWFVGAGGPMGQMHVQRAIAATNPSQTIVATDVDDARLHYLESRFSQIAEKKQIKLCVLNPGGFSKDSALAEKLSELTGSRGFDDIILLAPVAPAIEQGVRHAAHRAIVNVFAGVPIGTHVRINIDLIFNSCRIIGSSGSRVQDLQHTLELTEQGLISPNESVAAIGGMRALRDGIEAVQKGTFSGKVVIYPHIVDMLLTPLNELHNTMPSIAKEVAKGNLWTREAERALLEEKLVQ
jgi:threonine dehydrogenase-like Zn-dependent dehydrogenase